MFIQVTQYAEPTCERFAIVKDQMLFAAWDANWQGSPASRFSIADWQAETQGISIGFGNESNQKRRFGLTRFVPTVSETGHQTTMFTSPQRFLLA